MTTTSLTDQAVRDTIEFETTRNLFVVAGAGSGKTYSLVSRFKTLVLRDGIRLGNIAAVTFTEKAGAELRDRLRAAFEAATRTGSPGERARAEQALEELDLAAIGTLHSFASRVLMLHPIEAGLPPKLAVADEVGSSISMEEQWQGALDELLEDEAIRPALQRALLLGKLTQLQDLFKALTKDWDLIDSHVLASPPRPLQVPDLQPLLAAAVGVARVRQAATGSDALVRNYLDKADELVAALQSDDDLARFQALLGASGLPSILRDDGSGDYKKVGAQGHWTTLPGGIDDAKAAYDDFRTVAIRLADEAKTIVLEHLVVWLARRVLDAADERRVNGELVFHDLLVLARRLLRTSASVAGALSRRYTHLLLDEFQDTDPIQIELAVRIAGSEAGAVHIDWRDIDVPPGALFVVGDPKQSIYRFRRADIALYLQVQRWFAEKFGGAAILQLDTNFRSVPGVLGWVNEAFGQLIVADEDRQPEYEALREHRPALEGPTSAAVTYLGADEHEFAHSGNATHLRELEAADVAAVIARALAEGWTVLERDPITGATAPRPIRPADIAVLVPARTSLPMLGEALDAVGIPYRAEASSLVYQSENVAQLHLAAQAVADRSDGFALVMTLRSSLFGLGDDDLWRWKQAGGRFSLSWFGSDEAALRELPVYPAMDYLRTLSYEAPRLTPADVLDKLIRDRRAFEVVADAPDAADRWRRLRFVVDQARAWSENARGGLRSYLEWAKVQTSDNAKVYESILPETDLEAVRVMTVHAAKGLEFPMVVLSGMTAQKRRRQEVRLLWTASGYAVSVKSDLQTTNFAEAEPLDEQMGDAERRRLLYVAATRARDHLVVSLHRADRGGDTNAFLFAEVAPDDAALALPFDPGADAAPVTGGPRRVTPPPESRAAFAERLQLALRLASRQPSQSASGLEGSEPEVAIAVAGEEDEPRPDLPLAKDQRDLDTPSYNKGRDATAIGIAVHAVLQTIDLATGAGLDALADMQCLAGGIPQHLEKVKTLVGRALDSDEVKTAAAHQYWRESLLAMTDPDGTIIEGYADLIYRDASGHLHVVDYKTDTIGTPEALAERRAFYAPQLNAYAAILRAATGAEVTATPLFLDVATGPGGPQ